MSLLSQSNSPARQGAAVLIGSFQPFHNGHLALLRQALDAAPICVVIIGSAFQARSPDHPFTWLERAQMIRSALLPADRARVRFAPVRNHHAESRWVAAVRESVDAALGTQGSRLLVGHLKDETRDYLNEFAGWQWHKAEWAAPVTASAVRDAIFDAGSGDAESTLRQLADHLPGSTVEFLREWFKQPVFEQLKPEWQMLRDYQASWAGAPYPPVLFTVDCVVRCQGYVLLIRRGHAPGKGMLAVPGGFMEERETTRQTALRELEEETHLDLPAATLRVSLTATELFDRPGRSGRGRTLTHVHFFDLGDRDLPAVRADDDAAAVEWTPIARLPNLEGQFMDDHFQMLDHFLDLELAAAPVWVEEGRAQGRS
ncbi:NUDIX domain-containing protein [Variovorax sp. LjRoot84]|uniref:NUDIX domain-containing protein n=1 Tax=Variovorax sp. LjRoot84 TaxID=3342340 RepID=UPI003ED0FB1D